MAGTLDAVVALFEDGLTVTELVRDQHLCALPPDLPARDGHRLLLERGYHQAPLQEVPVWRFVRRDRLTGGAATVADAAEPIPDDLRTPESTPLLHAVVRLRDHPFLFATHRDQISGLVTRADLAQPAVSLLVLGSILALERTLDEVIARRVGDRWRDELTAERVARIERIHLDRTRRNAELDVTSALNLDDRLRLLRRSGGYVDLGFTSASTFRRWATDLSRMRDCTAHGDSILDAFADPADAATQLAALVAIVQRSRRQPPAGAGG